MEFGRTSEAPLRTTQRVSRSSVVTQAEGDSEAARAVRDVYNSLREMMERAQRDEQRPAMSVYTRDLSYHPPGCDAPLLSRVNLELPPRSLGLIYGRSGAGKTTLLHLLAGLSEPTGALAD